MRPKERRDSGRNDCFKARLDRIIDMDHALARLGRAIDWRFLEERFGAVYPAKAGDPPPPTLLMAGLSTKHHSHRTARPVPITSFSGGPSNLGPATRGIPPPPPVRRRGYRQPTALDERNAARGGRIQTAAHRQSTATHRDTP